MSYFRNPPNVSVGDLCSLSRALFEYHPKHFEDHAASNRRRALTRGLQRQHWRKAAKVACESIRMPSNAGVHGSSSPQHTSGQGRLRAPTLAL